MTLEELLSHTSGMHNSEVVPLNARDDAPGSIVERRRIWVDHILTQAPVTSRGSFNYSNQGYVVAGAMMETIVGTPFETLLQEQLFAPLGMTSTGYGAPGTPGNSTSLGATGTGARRSRPCRRVRTRTTSRRLRRPGVFTARSSTIANTCSRTLPEHEVFPAS